MQTALRVVDADSHYKLSWEEMAPYMDEPWRTRLTEGGKKARSSMSQGSTWDSMLWGKLQREHTEYPHDSMDPSGITAGMEFLGVDATIAISNTFLVLSQTQADDGRLLQFTKAFTDYVLEHVVDPDEGVYTFVPVPYYDVDASLELLDRVGDEAGIVGALFTTYQGSNHPLGNRRYEPIYELVDDLGLPAVFHTGGAGLDNYVRAGFERELETHALGFVESNMSQLTSIVVQGVPEKFPDLDIVFQEAGVFWIPMIMYRLDQEYLKRREEAPLLTKRPSEYVREFYFGTQPLETEAGDEHLEQVFEMLGGAERLLYCSDYPHWDYDAVNSITDRSFLSRAEKQQILAGNAERVFGI